MPDAAITVAESAGLTAVGRYEPGDVLGTIEGHVVLIGTSLSEVAWQLVERLLNAGGRTAHFGARNRVGRRSAARDHAQGACAVSNGRCRAAGGRAVALSAVARIGMTTLRLVGSPWRTDTFRRLATGLENIVAEKDR